MTPKARFEVFLTDVAERDVEEIVDFVEARESSERADQIFDRLKTSILGLEKTPDRGRVVPELRRIGVTEYRELLARPYRVVYFADGKRVQIVGVFDSRRDLADLLSDRLLR